MHLKQLRSAMAQFVGQRKAAIELKAAA